MGPVTPDTGSARNCGTMLLTASWNERPKVTSPPIDEKRVLIGLNDIGGFEFEAFAQAMYAAITGKAFVPLGGLQDGGADGFFDRGLFESTDQEHFVQITTQEDHRSKIRQTVERLHEVGRKPRSLTYITSRVVRDIDRHELELGDEVGVAIRIRDRNFLRAHVNDSSGTRAAFHNHIEPRLSFLRKAGSSPVIGRSRHVQSPDVYVFLRQEVERKEGHGTFLNAVLDALILWALEGTDPHEDELRSRDEVVERILETVPAAKQFATPARVNDRLQSMASKDYHGGRAVRWHQKENLYVLPWETRKRIEEENEEDTALHVQVKDDLLVRIAEAAPQLSEGGGDTAVDVAMEAIRRSFEKDGLAFAHFLSRKPTAGDERITIQDSVADVLLERGIGGREAAEITTAILTALRGSFYSSTERERLYLSKMSRTYGLLFTLNTEPRIVEYFQEMTADFHLYVGSDILIRALSERYLRPEDQMTRNMLKMAREAGAELILTEPVLEEVVGHLRMSDDVFQAEYAGKDDYLPTEFTRHIDQILIRAYFYARNETERHQGSSRSWEHYVNQFCDYGVLHRGDGKRALLDYLCSEFFMTFQDRDSLEALVSDEQLTRMFEAFRTVKSGDKLANNDALLTLAVLGRRRKEGESGRGTEFGYRTWWLTHEARIIHKVKKVLGGDRYEPFMMRPEFLLNFIALAPTTEQVRETYRNVFPSLQGIRLANRMDSKPFEKLMKRVDEAMELEPGRRQAAMSRLADRLKSDFAKDYETHLA